MCRHHPEPVVMALIHFLAPSRPIVVYCHLIEVIIRTCTKYCPLTGEEMAVLGCIVAAGR